MTFAYPILLFLLLAIPPVLVLKARTGEGNGAGGFSNVALLQGFRPTWRMRYRWFPTFVRAWAIAMLIIALARPQVGEADSELAGQGIDIALVLDTSGSMTAESLAAEDSRLDVAKRVLTEFIDGRTTDRLGLVVFRAGAIVLSPLTLDYDALTAITDDVGELNLPDGTAIGVGLSDSLNLLRESRARSRVAILLTDGENNAGEIEPLEAAQIAKSLGVRVYTIGVIETGARSRGRVNVDEEALREMAELTEGRYFPAESEEALGAIYASIDQLEKSRVDRTQFGIYKEEAIYFLAAAVALLAFELLLRNTLWRQAT
jgi:Ca-activated chloride channel family protein